MKKRKILFLVAALLLSSFMILQIGCKKDKDEEPETPTPPTYTNGQGEIGSIGGTVMIDDPQSPINGASIVIPEGALENSVDISIQEGSITSIAGHDNIKTIQLLPKGLEFSKEVEITLPWSKTNQTVANTRAYYLDEDNSTIQQLEIKNVDTQNKLTTAYTSHFSIFFSDPDELSHEIEFVKTGNYFAGYLNLQTGFDQIPAIINDGRNADDIIDQEDGLENCFVRLIFELHEKDGWFWSEVADMALYVSYDEWSSGWSIWVDKANSSVPILPGGVEQIFNKYELTFNQMTDTWMSGYPFLAIFDEDTYLNPDFSINQDNNYKLTCTWGIVKNYNGFLKPWVWTWQYNYCTEKQKWSEVSSFNGDANHNNIIDSYEGGGGNTPPTAIFTIDPSSGTTSTVFEFDGSDSYDNEDPTSDLQIRWDWENDGSWDTYWTTDKTENHQYGSEGTYTVKMEVKDTEGLTDYTTHTVTVNNGGGSTFTDPRDGQVYNIVTIGSQTWFAENLNYQTTNSWWYDNSSANGDVYGRLYTWNAALTACPAGWGLPSDDEWKILEGTVDTQYGVGSNEWDGTGWRGYDAGKRLKSTSGWYTNSGTDAFGFTALPGGYRYSSGSFYYLGHNGYWWSSSEYLGTYAWSRYLLYGYDQVYRHSHSKTYGFSVRCLKN